MLVGCAPAAVQPSPKPVVPTSPVENILSPPPVTVPQYELVQGAEDLITDSEVSSINSSHGYYDRHYEHPTWPQGDSGVTVGIGVDLGQQSAGYTETCWNAYLIAQDVKLLQGCAGITGKAAQGLCARLQTIQIVWPNAYDEFNTFEVPNYWSLTARTFPGFNELRVNAQGALVSLVYNRGSSMSGASRVDMRTIRAAVPDKDYEAMAEAESHMLVTCGNAWRNAGIYDGMKARRGAEAILLLTP
jgi:hypothetical protein